MSDPANFPVPNYENPELAGSLAGSLATSIVLGSFVVVAVVIRLWSRFRIVHRLGLDDIMIIVALGLGIAFNVYHERGIRDGWGRHIWDIPPERLSKLALDGLIATELYLAATGFIKLSILLFYRRLLHGSHGELFIYTRINYALIAVVVMAPLAFGLSLLFACSPIEAAWKQADPVFVSETNFSCINTPAVLHAIAYTCLFTDMAVVLFPLIFIRHIQIRRGDRWALRALFCICLVPCVAAVIRTIFQHLQYVNNDDFTYHGFYSLLWGTVEIYFGILCASAPALKPFFGKYLPTIFSHTGPTSKASYGKPSFRQRSSRRASTMISESLAKHQDVESDAHLELVSASNGSKPWDARSREFPGQVEPKPGAGQPAGVLKQVEVEVKYLPDAGQASQSTHSQSVHSDQV